MDKYYKPGEQIKVYSIIKIIGEGRYGIVYLAEDATSQKYIIKQLKKNMLETTQDKLFYEKKILDSLNDSRFPKFIEQFTDKDVVGYILEYISGKVFEDFLFRERHVFNKEEIYKIAHQLLEIIEALHKNNIVHRDIRPPNVILTATEELVLIDFGLARYIDDKRHVKEIDYWYLGDFLIHLYYTSYFPQDDSEEKPWYEELDLNEHEKSFLKKLMGIDAHYKSLESIRNDLEHIKNIK